MSNFSQVSEVRPRRDKEYRRPNCGGSLVTVMGHSFVRHIFRFFNGASVLAPYTICVPAGHIRDMELEVENIPDSTKVLFLKIGANDLSPRTADISQILDDFLHLLQSIRFKLPTVKIYFITCSYRIPSRDSHSHEKFCQHYNRRVDIFNKAILRLSYSYKYYLLDPELHSQELLARDGFHPNFKGLDRITTIINNIIWDELIYPPRDKFFEFISIPQSQDIHQARHANSTYIQNERVEEETSGLASGLASGHTGGRHDFNTRMPGSTNVADRQAGSTRMSTKRVMDTNSPQRQAKKSNVNERSSTIENI
jgi:hypothetical protein